MWRALPLILLYSSACFADGPVLCFEQNRGQVDATVKYIARSREGILWLAATEAVMRAASGTTRIQFCGADSNSAVRGVEELPGKVSYFVGKDASQWRAGAPTFAGVEYLDLYPGVTVHFGGREDSVNFDFVVQPGGDPARIAVRIIGSTPVQADPRAWQILSGTTQSVACAYATNAAGYLTFMLGAYDPAEPLFIR